MAIQSSASRAPAAAPQHGTTQRAARSRKGFIGSEAFTGGWMVAPAVTLIVVFLIVPVCLAFVLAFTNARLISPRPAEFVGLDNFLALVQDPTFLRSLLNTTLFALAVVPLQAGFGLVLAMLVNAKVRGSNFFRTVYFVPVVTSMVVVSLLWRFMYERNGLVNQALEAVTFGAFEPIDWLNDPRTALPAIIFMSIWQGVGFHMVIWLAGLQTIPAELYEAAAIDGAAGWKRFWYITWPSLIATRTLVLITITISALSLFTQVSVMTQGGPLNSTTTVVFHAVRTGYERLQTGYASAISLVFFALVLIISGVQRYLTREKD